MPKHLPLILFLVLLTLFGAQCMADTHAERYADIATTPTTEELS